MDTAQAQAVVAEMQSLGAKMAEMVGKMKETDVRAKQTESDMQIFHQGANNALSEIRKGQSDLSANIAT